MRSAPPPQCSLLAYACRRQGIPLCSNPGFGQLRLQAPLLRAYAPSLWVSLRLIRALCLKAAQPTAPGCQRQQLRSAFKTTFPHHPFSGAVKIKQMISAIKSSACGRFIHSFSRSSSVTFRRLHFTTSSLFHFVHSTSLSTPRQKPHPCSTPQIQPFGIPVFGNLPSIQLNPLILFIFHKHIKILYIQ